LLAAIRTLARPCGKKNGRFRALFETGRPVRNKESGEAKARGETPGG